MLENHKKEWLAMAYVKSAMTQRLKILRRITNE